MPKREAESKIGRLVGIGLLIAAVLALLWQARSLYTFPIPDSVNYWYGDESWVMLEARTHIEQGVLRHPYAYGATLNNYAGMFIGSSWVSSLAYGAPAALISSVPVVAIGRSVSLIVAFFSLVACFIVARKLGASWLAAGTSAVLLAASPAFVIASHSARSDVLVGLVVLLTVGHFASLSINEFSRRGWMLFGAAMTTVAIVVAVHLITLLLPLSVVLLWRYGAFRKVQHLVAAALGALGALALLAGIYYFTSHDFSLFGTHGQHVQFADVAGQKPIVRLFSRSVQWNNLLQRFRLLWGGALPIVIAFIVGIICAIIKRIRRSHHTHTNPTSANRFLLFTLVVTLSWLLLQGSITYYVPHVLACFALAAAFLMDGLLVRYRWASVVWCVTLIVFIGLRVVASERVIAASELFTHENHRAQQKLVTGIHQTGVSKPVVLMESPCAYGLELDTSIRPMAPLFTAFPVRDEPVAQTLGRYHVRYALLYDASALHDDIAGRPTLNEYIETHGHLIDTAIGFMFDMRRDYVHPDLSRPDTMKLFELGHE